MLTLGQSDAAKEHVTLPVDEYPAEFKISRLRPPPALSRPQWKLSVDTQTDLKCVKNVIDALDSHASQSSVADIVGILDSHPEWCHPETYP